MFIRGRLHPRGWWKASWISSRGILLKLRSFGRSSYSNSSPCWIQTEWSWATTGARWRGEIWIDNTGRWFEKLTRLCGTLNCWLEGEILYWYFWTLLASEKLWISNQPIIQKVTHWYYSHITRCGAALGRHDDRPGKMWFAFLNTSVPWEQNHWLRLLWASSYNKQNMTTK